VRGPLRIHVIGHVGNSLFVRGGLEVHLDEMAQELVRRGHLVDRSLGRATGKPDLVHFVGAFYGLGDAFRASEGIPRVVSPILLHDDNAIRSWRIDIDRWRGLVPGSLMAARRLMLREADLVIAHSASEADEARRWGASSVTVVPTGIFINRFVVDQCDMDSMGPEWSQRVKSFTEMSSPHIVSIGRFERRKNHLEVARACNELGAQLLVIGRRSPMELRWLDELAGLAGSNLIIWEDPPDSAVAAALAIADVHVLASRHETTGLVSLEAAAGGARPVAVDQSTAREYLGSFGVLASSHRPVDLADAIATALIRGRLSGNEHASVTAFDWESIGERLEAEYRSVV